jgi:hypothetical protein
MSWPFTMQLGFLDCLGIVGAFHRFISNEMSVSSYCVRSIICHARFRKRFKSAGLSGIRLMDGIGWAYVCEGV